MTKNNRKTGFMVRIDTGNHQAFLCIDTKGIMYRGTYGRVSKFANPAVFDSRKEIYAAINRTRAFWKKQNQELWPDNYEIIPVVIVNNS